MPLVPEPEHMLAAISAARESRRLGDYAVGSSVALGDKVIAACGNRTHLDTDPTAHAELLAIRASAVKLRRKDLSECVLYATHEPCPMCIAAAIWARIPTVVFGVTRDDHREYRDRHGNPDWPWRVVDVPAREIAERGEPRVTLIAGFLRDECLDLFHS